MLLMKNSKSEFLGNEAAEPAQDSADFWKMKYFQALNELRASNRAIKRLAKRRKPKSEDMVESLLDSPTSMWVNLLEGLVSKHSYPAPDAPQRTHVYTVYSELLDYVRNALDKRQKDSPQFDHMISGALIISWILAAWALAATHAKAHDKRRPMKDRRAMLLYERRFARAFASYLIGRPEMRGPWSEQEWENPFTVKAEIDHRDGKDVEA
mgnify:CR=1 FL=1